MLVHCSFDVAQNDTLLETIERLERAIEASSSRSPKAWAEQMGGVLADVERQMQQLRAQWNTPESPFQAVDGTRPTLVRQLSELRSNFAHALFKASKLRAKFDRGTAKLGRDVEQRDPRLRVDSARRQCQAILDALRTYEAEEVKLVLESSYTDLGAGD